MQVPSLTEQLFASNDGTSVESKDLNGQCYGSLMGRSRGRGMPLCSVPRRGTLVWGLLSDPFPELHFSLVLSFKSISLLLTYPRIPCLVLGRVKAAYLSPSLSLPVVDIYRPGAKSGRSRSR